MTSNPLEDMTERIKQQRLEKSLEELIVELKKVNTRLDSIEKLLNSNNKSDDKTYIKG